MPDANSTCSQLVRQLHRDVRVRPATRFAKFMQFSCQAVRVRARGARATCPEVSQSYSRVCKTDLFGQVGFTEIFVANRILSIYVST